MILVPYGGQILGFPRTIFAFFFFWMKKTFINPNTTTKSPQTGANNSPGQRGQQPSKPYQKQQGHTCPIRPHKPNGNSNEQQNKLHKPTKQKTKPSPMQKPNYSFCIKSNSKE